MDLLILISVVVVIGGIGHWLITYFELQPLLSKLLYAALVVLLGLYFLDGIGFHLPNILNR